MCGIQGYEIFWTSSIHYGHIQRGQRNNSESKQFPLDLLGCPNVMKECQRYCSTTLDWENVSGNYLDSLVSIHPIRGTPKAPQVCLKELFWSKNIAFRARDESYIA